VSPVGSVLNSETTVLAFSACGSGSGNGIGIGLRSPGTLSPENSYSILYTNSPTVSKLKFGAVVMKYSVAGSEYNTRLAKSPPVF